MAEDGVELHDRELREGIFPVDEGDKRGRSPGPIQAPGRQLHLRGWIAKDPLEGLAFDRRTFATQHGEIRKSGIKARHGDIAARQPALDVHARLGLTELQLPAPHEGLQVVGAPHANHAGRRHRNRSSCSRMASAPSGR